MTCNRVLILHEGRILAADTPENLQQLMSEGGQVIAEIAAPPQELKTCWDEIPEVEYFNLAPAEGEYTRCSLTARTGIDLRPRVFELVCERGWKMRELTSNRHSLEDIFVRVTKADKEESF